MATLTIFSSAGDGYVAARPPAYSTWQQQHDASSGSQVNYTDTQVQITAQTSPDIFRAFFPFDTSTLPDDCTINSATFSFWVGSLVSIIGDSVRLIETTQASTSSLVLSDYSLVGTTNLGNEIALTSLTAGAYNTITLNATGLALINKTGFTKLGLRCGSDIDNSAFNDSDYQVNIVTSENTGTSQDPKLVITYTENTTTSTSSSTSTTSTSSSTSSSTSTTTTQTSTSTTTTSTSTTSTTRSTSTTTTSTTTTSSSTTTTSSSTTMPFSIAVDNV